MEFGNRDRHVSYVKFSGETEWTEEAIHYSKHDPEAPYYSVWGPDPIPQ